MRYMHLADGDFTSVPVDREDAELFARLGEKWAATYRLYALREDAKRGLDRPVYSAAAAMRAVFGKKHAAKGGPDARE